MSRVRAFALLAVAAAWLAAPVTALADDGPPQGIVDLLGRFHPFLVHFPVGLILAALVAETLFVVRRDMYFGSAALFMVTAAAWVALPAFIVGFAAAAGEVFGPEVAGSFSIHRVAGIITPMLAFIASGMGHSTRRSGQVWELYVYRAFLLLAAAGVAVAGHSGGVLVHGPEYFPF